LSQLIQSLCMIAQQKEKGLEMKLLLYYFISFVLFGDTLFALEIFGIDTETITRWEILIPAAILLLVAFIYRWRRSMRMEKRSVRIQFLDD